MREIIQYIAAVDVLNMPDEVRDYCEECDYPTHCDNEIVQVENDGNVLAEWLIANGYEFKGERDSIGIWGT